uniref:Uncharacterized protein n=1 Tax=Romanomermis culicivorax TaxID=13658 RepID=A0A915HIG8_ROMCU
MVDVFLHVGPSLPQDPFFSYIIEFDGAFPETFVVDIWSPTCHVVSGSVSGVRNLQAVCRRTQKKTFDSIVRITEFAHECPDVQRFERNVASRSRSLCNKCESFIKVCQPFQELHRFKVYLRSKCTKQVQSQRISRSQVTAFIKYTMINNPSTPKIPITLLVQSKLQKILASECIIVEKTEQAIKQNNKTLRHPI